MAQRGRAREINPHFLINPTRQRPGSTLLNEKKTVCTHVNIFVDHKRKKKSLQRIAADIECLGAPLPLSLYLFFAI